MTTITDTYLAAQVRAAIESRLSDRRWYRRMAAADPDRYGTFWADLARDNTIRLRELVRVSRAARDLVRTATQWEASKAKLDALITSDAVGV